MKNRIVNRLPVAACHPRCSHKAKLSMFLLRQICFCARIFLIHGKISIITCDEISDFANIPLYFFGEYLVHRHDLIILNPLDFLKISFFVTWEFGISAPSLWDKNKTKFWQPCTCLFCWMQSLFLQGSPRSDSRRKLFLSCVSFCFDHIWYRMTCDYVFILFNLIFQTRNILIWLVNFSWKGKNGIWVKARRVTTFCE